MRCIKKLRKIFCTCVIGIFSVAYLAAVPVTQVTVDSAEARAQIKDLYFTSPLPVLRELEPRIITNAAGDVFQVRVEETEEAVLVIVAPQKAEKLESYTSSGVVVSWLYTYPADIPGSWVLYRNKTTGKPECIRYYYTGESSMYVQFRPASGASSGKSLVDMIVGGRYRARNVAIGLSIESFYTASFASVKTATEHSIPWYSFAPYSEMYDGTRQMVAVIRENLYRFRYVDGIVPDENGNPAYVGVTDAERVSMQFPVHDDENRLFVSSCGFVKWIADGMVRPISGTGLLVEPLLRPTIEFLPGSLAASWADDYNTTLSLNWTRNIASAVGSVFSGNDRSYEESGVLVNTEPFSAIYSATTGYKTEGLYALMYHLAVTDPDRFYLGAIRHTLRGESEVSLYNDAVAFFPWIDEYQKFHCAVFMNGTETTIADFTDLFRGDFVQLVRIAATEQFFPR